MSGKDSQLLDDSGPENPLEAQTSDPVYRSATTISQQVTETALLIDDHVKGILKEGAATQEAESKC